jgi:hypothetical protein
MVRIMGPRTHASYFDAKDVPLCLCRDQRQRPQLPGGERRIVVTNSARTVKPQCVSRPAGRSRSAARACRDVPEWTTPAAID